MTLHEAIERVLIEYGRPMATGEIARAIAEKNLYKKSDSDSLTPSQVAARVNNYPDLFDRLGDEVALRNRSSDSLLRLLFHISDRLRSKSIYNLDLIIGYLLFYFRASVTQMGAEYFTNNLFDRNRDFTHGYGDDLKLRILDSVKRFSKHESFSDLDHELVSTFNKLSNANLIEIVGDLQSFDFEDASITDQEFARAFNSFINSFSGGGRESDAAITPTAIANYVSSIIRVSGHHSFCDPFAGNAGLASELLSGHSGYDCVLQDVNSVSVLLGRMNLLLHGVHAARYHCGDTIDLYSTPLDGRKFDIVVTHPPFGVKYGSDAFYKLPATFLPSNSRGENVHIQIAVHLLNDVGKAAVLIPDGFLFTNDSSSREIKSWLLNNDWIEAVYSLPGGSFKPYSAVNTSLLVINKNKSPEQSRKILFKEVSESEFSSAQQKKDMPDFVSEPTASYNNTINREVKVDLNEVFENDLLLNVNRYIDKVDLGEEYRSLHNIINNHALGVGVPKKFLDSREGIPYITIKDLTDSEKDFILGQESITTFISKTSIVKPHHIVRGGAILIAKVGAKLKPTLFIGNTAAFSSNILALYPNENLVISEYLVTQFNEPYFRKQLNQIRGGAVQVFVRLEDFLRLKVKLPSLESQEKELFQLFRQREHSTKSHRDEREQDEKSAQRVLFSAIKHEFSNLHVLLSGGITSLRLYLADLSKKGSINWTDKIVNLPEARSIQEVIIKQEQVLHEMGSLFDDVQALLALDRTQLKKERVFLKSFIHDQVDQMKEQLKDVKVFIGLSDKMKKDRIVVNIDKQLFAKVIKNFLTNSVKHGFSEGSFDQKMIIFDFSMSEDELSIELTMMNNGNKFPDGFTFVDFISFGVKTGNNKGAGIGGFLINEVIKFHDGTFEEVKYPDGTVLKITENISSKGVSAILSRAFIPGIAFKIGLPFNE